MTRREFDAATKRNYGTRMAWDTREAYRWERGIDDDGRDRLTERWREMQRRNTPFGVIYDGFLPTLGRGSKWRTFAQAGRSVFN